MIGDNSGIACDNSGCSTASGSGITDDSSGSSIAPNSGIIEDKSISSVVFKSAISGGNSDGSAASNSSEKLSSLSICINSLSKSDSEEFSKEAFGFIS